MVVGHGPRTSSSIWYVAYGANCSLQGLMRYLDPTAQPTAARWLTIPHRRYFAGVSARWNGGVAFVELTAQPEVQTTARAYLLSMSHLAQIVRGENRAEGRIHLPDMGNLDVGDWARCVLPESSDPTRNKYDALVRLADIDGVPAVTVSTAHRLVRRNPSPEYRDAIRAALASGPVTSDLSAT